MKKLLFILSVFVLCFGLAGLKPTQVSAATDERGDLVSTEVEYLSDGSYIVSELYESKSNTNARATSYNKTGERIVTKYSSTDDVLWVYTLTGYFTVTEGVSCVCYNATYSTQINNSSWSFSDGATSYSGNEAYGVGKFKLKFLFITTQTVNIDIHVACDEYGTIS